jgi:hypothetical protein
MTLIACASVSGAPGVTTAALGLAACWPPGASPVLAEADPSGGDLQVLFGLPESPGAVSLAAAARRAGGRDLLWQHVQWLGADLAVLPGPAGAGQAAAAGAALAAVGYAPVTAAAGHGTVVIADCGRADPGTPAAPLMQAADLLLIVTGTAPEALAHLHARLGALRDLSPRLQLLLCGARGPWPAAEVSQALGAPVAGELPADRAGAAVLRGLPVRRGPATRWRDPRGLPLLAAAGRAATRLAAAVPPPGLAAAYRAAPSRPAAGSAPGSGQLAGEAR